MKVTFVKDKPAPPPPVKEVVITLTLAEAKLLRALCGALGGTKSTGYALNTDSLRRDVGTADLRNDLTDNLFYELDNEI